MTMSEEATGQQMSSFTTRYLHSQRSISSKQHLSLAARGDWQRRTGAMPGRCPPTTGAINTGTGEPRGVWVFPLPQKQLKVH